MKNNKFLLCIVTVLLTASLLLTGCSDGPSASFGTSEPSGSSGSSGSGRTSGSSGESSGSSSDSETPEPGKLELFYEVSGGTATVTGVRGKPDGTVTIPEKTPDGVTVARIDSYAFYNSGITGIILPDTITYIGDYAFAGSALRQLVLPNSLKIVGKAAFSACRSLTSVVLNGAPEYQGSESTGVFSGCDQLQTITITSGLTRLGDGMFAHCTKLSTVVLPDTLTHIGESAFFSCHALKSITLPDALTTLDKSAFADCRASASPQR